MMSLSPLKHRLDKNREWRPQALNNRLEAAPFIRERRANPSQDGYRQRASPSQDGYS